MLTIAEARRRLGIREITPPPAPPRVTLEDYQAHVHRRLKELKITVEWRASRDMPAGALAYAAASRRHIVTPPMDSETEIAIALHEIGHVAAEPCRGGDHYRDPAVREWWHCLKCEVLACANAICLCRPLPWSRRMHKELMRCLKIYRGQTPGRENAKKQIDSLATDLRWYELTLESAMSPQVSEFEGPPPPPPPKKKGWQLAHEASQRAFNREVELFIESIWQKEREQGR